MTGPGGLPSLDQRVRRSASDPISRHPPRVGSYRSQEADMLRQQPSIGQSVNTIDEMVHSSRDRLPCPSQRCATS